MGVINGRVAKPDDLVKPSFPSAARLNRASGSVYVRVLIDEEGNVVEAKTTFGHPLLRAAATNAARKSKFKPIIIGNSPVKVSGIIIYNFVPESFNWLEIGYTLQSRNTDSVYSMKNLVELLPFEFEAERQLLLLLNDEKENNDSIILSVKSTIEGKLTDKAKERWLFSIGSCLSKLEMSFQYKDEQQQTLFYELRFNVQNMPEGANPSLKKKLQKLLTTLENVEFSEKDDNAHQTLNEILEVMPYLGR